MVSDSDTGFDAISLLQFIPISDNPDIRYRYQTLKYVHVIRHVHVHATLKQHEN
jgi:hypothetical protein